MPIRLKTIFNPNLHKNVVMWTWPSGSKQYLFLFVLFSRDSLLVFIFFIIFCFDGLNAWDLPFPTTFRGFVMVSSLEFHGWSTCTNNFQPPQWTSLVETADSHDSDREARKIMKKWGPVLRWIVMLRPIFTMVNILHVNFHFARWPLTNKRIFVQPVQFPGQFLPEIA